MYILIEIGISMSMYTYMYILIEIGMALAPCPRPPFFGLHFTFMQPNKVGPGNEARMAYCSEVKYCAYIGTCVN